MPSRSHIDILNHQIKMLMKHQVEIHLLFGLCNSYDSHTQTCIVADL